MRPGVEERARSLYGSRGDQDEQLYLATTERSTCQVAGEVVLENLDTDNRSCGFRIALVGPRAYGRGFGSDATALILAHAFETAGSHRVELEVHDFNPRARHLCRPAADSNAADRRPSAADVDHHN
jgi:RimJ/RimL family protein N-acetyltransferase